MRHLLQAAGVGQGRPVRAGRQWRWCRARRIRARSRAATRFTGTWSRHTHSPESLLPVSPRVRARRAQRRRDHRLRAPSASCSTAGAASRSTCRSASVDFIEVLQGGRLDTGAGIVPELGLPDPAGRRRRLAVFRSDAPGRRADLRQGRWSVHASTRGSRLPAGHVYVTNGPFLELHRQRRADGRGAAGRAGDEAEIAAAAHSNPDVDTLDRLELVVLGDVVARSRPRAGPRRASKDAAPPIAACGSRCARTADTGAQFNTIAHSAPIYVVVDDQPAGSASGCAVSSLAARAAPGLLTVPVDPTAIWNRGRPWKRWSRQWERQRQQLRPRVSEAEAKYDAILKTGDRRANAHSTAQLRQCGYHVRYRRRPDQHEDPQGM